MELNPQQAMMIQMYLGKVEEMLEMFDFKAAQYEAGTAQLINSMLGKVPAPVVAEMAKISEYVAYVGATEKPMAALEALKGFLAQASAPAPESEQE